MTEGGSGSSGEERLGQKAKAAAAALEGGEGVEAEVAGEDGGRHCWGSLTSDSAGSSSRCRFRAASKGRGTSATPRRGLRTWVDRDRT